jgi:hypothetical protein
MATVCANPVFMATARNGPIARWIHRVGEGAHSFFISVICISAGLWHFQRGIERNYDQFESARTLAGA